MHNIKGYFVACCFEVIALFTNPRAIFIVLYLGFFGALFISFQINRVYIRDFD
jgi:hypothetical protein